MFLRTFEPENRLVARGLETEWEKRLRDLAAAKAGLERRERQRPRLLSEEEKKKIRSLSSDLHKVWTAPTTTDRDRKELLRTLLEEVIITVNRSERCAHMTLRGKGSALTEIDLSKIHRWLNDGFIAGERATSGAPSQIRLTDELRARFVEQTPPGHLPMVDATRKLGVSRQTVLQRVKRGDLEAVLVTRGRRKGLRIKVVDSELGLFQE